MSTSGQPSNLASTRPSHTRWESLALAPDLLSDVTAASTGLRAASGSVSNTSAMIPAVHVDTGVKWHGARGCVRAAARGARVRRGQVNEVCLTPRCIAARAPQWMEGAHSRGGHSKMHGNPRSAAAR